MSSVNSNGVREILEWELSLDSRDIRAHAWYHGAMSRQKAEAQLLNNGDFLVRDCSSSGRPGDVVLSCRWDNANLHFLIHKDVVQKDTIYEQLRFRFESDSFDTVPDLITYHVGSGIAISAGSGALITNPRNRTSPLLKAVQKNLIVEGVRSDYVSICRAESEPVPVFSIVEKVSTLERLKQKSLNLSPPVGLIEELESIPEKLLNRIENERNENSGGNIWEKVSSSNFDLNLFSSILLPANDDNVKLDRGLFQIIIARLLESSDRSAALHLTKLDYNLLTGNEGSVDDLENTSKIENNDANELSDGKKIYEKLFHDSQHRWNNIIERSLSFSHFVVATIVMADNPELTINKWINIAGELKSSVGNFFSFASIMRGLLMPQITRSDGNINWLQLRQQFTTATFNFETIFRAAYQGLVKGTECYPPITTISELFLVALILEDVMEMMPSTCISAEESQLQFFCNHLKQIRSLASWSSIQRRNLERQLAETSVDDIVLQDIFRTELHLILLWGSDYPDKSLKERCAQMDSFIKNS
ncbi:unnamed protein product [Allacma fusca]|uniref:SH2 domain-containing protein n=1 Tax=Allacma fusca TaxID=39272 RepID=A0A8J2J947_9HEXA|nr:unnamed protein product [Allacma fusca]